MEELADWTFIREQTDLPYFIRTDTGQYLRQTDVEGEGREDQMYQWVPGQGVQLADRANLHLHGVEVGLEGTCQVALADGSTVAVEPVCAHLKEHPDRNCTPEKQQEITGVHPDTIAGRFIP